MNYVDSLNLFGVEAKEIPCIKLNGSPTESTEGVVGLLAMDTLTGDLYKCISVANGVYTWKSFGNDDNPQHAHDKVIVTDTTPTTATMYYMLYAQAASGEQVVRANTDLYYYDIGGSSYFNVGSAYQKGGLTLHHFNGKYINLVTAAPTKNRDIQLPDADGVLVTEDRMMTAINNAIAGAIGNSY